jgi:hypothetical protein
VVKSILLDGRKEGFVLKLIREIQVWKNKFEFPEKVFCFVPDKNQKSMAQKKTAQ